MIRFSIALISVLFTAGVPTHAGVLVEHDRTAVYVHDGDILDASDLWHTGGTTAATTIAGFSGVTTSRFSSSAAIADFQQSRGGEPFATVEAEVRLYFRVDTDTPFVASGAFTNSSGYSVLTASLQDASARTYLFESEHQRYGAAAVTLGETPIGVDRFSGSLTGTLIAGRPYIWTAFAFTQANPTDAGATATGRVSLTFLPEPSTATLAFTACATFSLHRRRSLLSNRI